MKNILIGLAIFCVFGFTVHHQFQEDKMALVHQKTDFDWLLGSWIRTNEKEGLKTFEHWKQINDTEFKGIGYTLKEADTVWQESIKLIKIKEQWNFVVKGQDADAPTVFKVTKIEIASFTCENPDNEFPKKIRYTKVEKGLNAVISGDGKVILFQFASTP